MSSENLPAIRAESNALVPYGSSEAEIEAANQRRKAKLREKIRAWCGAALVILSCAIVFTGELQAAGRISDGEFMSALLWYLVAVLLLGWIVQRFAPEDRR